MYLMKLLKQLRLPRPSRHLHKHSVPSHISSQDAHPRPSLILWESFSSAKEVDRVYSEESRAQWRHASCACLGA